MAQLRADFKAPIPDGETLSRFGRLRFRTRRMVKKYGWKLVVGVFVFYLIRDLALYVVLPYMAIKLAW
jgi:hypothetical protein